MGTNVKHDHLSMFFDFVFEKGEISYYNFWLFIMKEYESSLIFVIFIRERGEKY